MIALPRLVIVMVCVVFLAPFAAAQSPAGYRNFEFGMSLEAVAAEAQVTSKSAQTIHTAPNLIQMLHWDAPGYLSSSADTDPVRSIRFTFYDNQLFKIIATYGRREVEGMTSEDMIEAISAVYGPSSRPDETIVVTASTIYEDRQKVIARWVNNGNVFDLFQSSYGGEFGLAGYSEKLDALAAISIREAKRLDTLAAPQREIDRQRKEADEQRIREEAARSLNRPNFRP
jgi:hypothetical protein